MERLNKVEYSGLVTSKKELARKADGAIWGYSLLVAQMGSTCEFLVTKDQFVSVPVNSEVEVYGHLEQRGFNLEVKIDNLMVLEPSNN